VKNPANSDSVLPPKLPSIEEAISAKFSHPHFVTLFEVRDSTGFDSSRSADAIAVGMYRTRGREITGFEIKRSRSDWLSELKNPAKAEEIGKFCDWFYLVTSNDSIAKIDEIPAQWGWMFLNGQRLKVLKKPERMKAVPLDRHMLCSLLFSLRKDCYSQIEKQINEKVAQRLESQHSGLQYTARNWEERFKELEKNVREYENASGVSISNGWNHPGKVGEAVRMVMNESKLMDRFKNDVRILLCRAESIVGDLSRNMAELEKESNGHKQ
jgi:hypothetical protein